MSIISYFGSKSSSTFQSFINSKIPKTGIKKYIEPFSGAMGTYMNDNSLVFDTVIFRSAVILTVFGTLILISYIAETL